MINRTHKSDDTVSQSSSTRRTPSRTGSRQASRFPSRRTSQASSNIHYSSFEFGGPNDRIGRAEFDYDLWLMRYRKDFYKKYGKDVPSPSTGLEEFENVAKLGEGKFGRVHLVKEYNTGAFYAAKIMQKEQIVRLKHVRQVISEKKILFALKFPFIITLLFSTKDNDCVYLGLPFVIGGDLFTYHRKRQKFSEPDARFYAAQIYMALEYLHGINCIYRDLKPENILIDAKGYLKLTDFGFAKLTEDRTMTLCGTPEYLAPEIINMKPYGRGVDWWAYGIMLFEFVAGVSPFSRFSGNVMDMFTRICDGDYEMPPTFSIELQDLIVRLLEIDMSKRIGSNARGCKDIQKHLFFKNVSWSALLFQDAVPPFIPRVVHEGDIQHFRRWSGAKARFHYTPSINNRFQELFRDF